MWSVAVTAANHRPRIVAAGVILVAVVLIALDHVAITAYVGSLHKAPGKVLVLASPSHGAAAWIIGAIYSAISAQVVSLREAYGKGDGMIVDVNTAGALPGITRFPMRKSINKPQQGESLLCARLEMVEEPGRFLEVATTRPETIMADTGCGPSEGQAICRSCRQTCVASASREKIPIVADDAIDPEFGTGVLKVTPAHDKLDFEIGQRHKLPVLDVLTPNGRIDCQAVPELHGLDRFEARKKAAELLQDRQLLSKAEPHENNVGFSERSEVPIEPRLSEQWFLRYPKTKEALAVVRDHLIRFFPAHWEKVYAQWLENIQDWCISRQVWWGHRIPAWYRTQSWNVRV